MCPDTPEPADALVILTCEHGGNEVPPPYRSRFRGHARTLATHRGYDIGALPVALRIASRLSAPIIFSTVTRLLVDLNRSIDHPHVFSEFTRDLPGAARDDITDAFYTPHRTRVERLVADTIEGGSRVVHVGVHSCTDELAGNIRDLDIALLFDAARPAEHAFCESWREELRRRAGDLRYPFNEPYLGSDDGLTTTLRHRFDPRRYLGIEVELRQGFVKSRADQKAAGDLLAGSLHAAVAEHAQR